MLTKHSVKEGNIKVFDKSGKLLYFQKISTPIKALYFSASWCPVCQNVTPKLIEFYNAVNKPTKKLEIVFVSRDTNEQSFENHYKDMPWLAIGYSDPEREELKTKYSVTRIPTLIIVDCNSDLLCKEGVKDVRMAEEKDYEKVLEKWAHLKMPVTEG